MPESDRSICWRVWILTSACSARFWRFMPLNGDVRQAQLVKDNRLLQSRYRRLVHVPSGPDSGVKSFPTWSTQGPINH